MKKCEPFRDWIWLAVYDELPVESQKILDEHLQSCSSCQTDLAEAKKLTEVMNRKIQLTPTAAQLETSRVELHRRLLSLKQPGVRENWGTKLWKMVSLDFAPALRFATAMGLLIIGLLSGKIIFGPDKSGLEFNQQQLSEAISSNISHIETIEYNPATRQVSIIVNTLNDVVIQGDVEQPEIQQLLAHTLIAEDRPNMRLKTVKALEKTRNLDVSVITSLSDLLAKEENPGIRLKAVRLLTSIPISSTIKEVLTQVLMRVLLNDSNSAIRIEAFKGLSKINNGKVAPVIFNAAQDDSSEYIQTKAKQILERTENPDFTH